MKDHAVQIKEFITKCREAGLKATHQRVEIYSVLASTGEHPDAETIYERVKKRIPSISFDTVYRTLKTLQSKKLITRVNSCSDRAQYDANQLAHHHFRCCTCGKIRDFYAHEFDHLAVPVDALKWGQAQGVVVEVLGVCNECNS